MDHEAMELETAFQYALYVAKMRNVGVLSPAFHYYTGKISWPNRFNPTLIEYYLVWPTA